MCEIVVNSLPAERVLSVVLNSSDTATRVKEHLSLFAPFTGHYYFIQMGVMQPRRRMSYAKMKGLVSFFTGKFDIPWNSMNVVTTMCFQILVFECSVA